MAQSPLRFHEPHLHLTEPFGEDRFGQIAERVARLFGTPQYIVGQTVIVIIWIALNGYAILVHFDPYPFILLNLAFSTQAAYAAPLILLAQTRQAERDKMLSEADAKHREAIAQTSLDRQEEAEKIQLQLKTLLESNTDLTSETKKLAEHVETLTRDIHKNICATD